MNTITRNRFLNTVVVILLILNLFAMVIFWWHKWKDSEIPPKTLNSGAAAFLVENLDFDSLQLKTFRKLQLETQDKIMAAKDSVRLYKDHFFDLLDKDSVSEADIAFASNRAAAMQIQLDRISYDFFKRVQLICNADQKIKFHKIIREALRIMGRPGPPPNARFKDPNLSEDHFPEGPPPERPGFEEGPPPRKN